MRGPLRAQPMTRERSGQARRSAAPRDRTRELLDAAEEPIAKIDAQHRILRVNPAFRRRLAWDASTVANNQVRMLVPREHRAALERLLGTLFEDRIPDRALVPTVDGYGQTSPRIWSGIPSLLERRPRSAWLILEPFELARDGDAPPPLTTISNRWPHDPASASPAPTGGPSPPLRRSPRGHRLPLTRSTAPQPTSARASPG